MLLPFKLGFGGVIGGGPQYISWITIHDAIQAIFFLLNNRDISGPVNIVSPNPVTNYVFTKTLAQELTRPAFIPLPGIMVKLILGQMAEELLLSSARVVPRKLLNTGFKFNHPQLDHALKFILKPQV